MKYLTIGEWKQRLGSYYAEALEDSEDCEIFDKVVNYMGSGVEARSLVELVYGIDLKEVAHRVCA